MKRMWLAVVVVAAVAAFTTPARAVDEDLVVTLRGIVANGYQAYANEDFDTALSYIHTKSPDYEKTKQRMPSQFRDLDLDVDIVDFRYIGHDDEFAVARLKYKTTGGSGFQDNVTDSIVLFKQEGGVWKFWTNTILGVVFVDE